MSYAQDLLAIMQHGGLWILGLGLLVWLVYAVARRNDRKRAERDPYDDDLHRHF